MRVILPTPLAEYTRHAREVQAEGATLDELLADLDRRYPGIRFRIIDEQDAIRPHIKIFVNREQAWFTVKRQAMCGDALDPAGLYFGTTSGEVWASVDEGEAWRCIARHLPHIYSLEASARS